MSTLFIDNFSGAKGAKPDASKWSEWSNATYGGAYGNIGTGERATLDGSGHLSIPATPSQGTAISTKDHSRFTTGTFTARMKVQTQQGYWPSFWTLNNNPSGVNRTQVGEVDVIEAYTQYNDGYRRAVHNYVPADQSKNWSTAENPLCGGGDIRGTWHDYSAKIEANTVTFYFDGVQCGNPVLRSEQAGKPWAFAPDNVFGNWMILANAVDTASGAPAPTQNSVLLVDYVKVTR